MKLYRNEKEREMVRHWFVEVGVSGVCNQADLSISQAYRVIRELDASRYCSTTVSKVISAAKSYSKMNETAETPNQPVNDEGILRELIMKKISRVPMLKLVKILSVIYEN